MKTCETLQNEPYDLMSNENKTKVNKPHTHLSTKSMCVPM